MTLRLTQLECAIICTLFAKKQGRKRSYICFKCNKRGTFGEKKEGEREKKREREGGRERERERGREREREKEREREGGRERYIHTIWRGSINGPSNRGSRPKEFNFSKLK